MLQPGFFDLETRLGKLDQLGDPLSTINAVVGWSVFQPILVKGLRQQKKSNAGRPGFDPLLMFKVLILQNLYNLADGQTEFQIRDRFTFMRFLGLSPECHIPDEKKIWFFRENMEACGLREALFTTFTRFLEAQGYAAKRGTAIDVRLVEVPKQRNTRSENATIEEGLMPAAWDKHPANKIQKDIEARWTLQSGKNYYGYKNHIAIDAKHKFIRGYDVTAANVHDSQRFESPLDRRNSDPTVYADSGYRGTDNERLLKRKRFKSRVHHRAWRDQPLTKHEGNGKTVTARVFVPGLNTSSDIRQRRCARLSSAASGSHVFGHGSRSPTSPTT